MLPERELNRARASRLASHVREAADDNGIKVFFTGGAIRFEMDFNTAERLVKKLDEHEEWSET